MDDLSTLPASVRREFEKNLELAKQNSADDGQAALLKVAEPLARTNPDIYAAVIALSLGYTELSFTDTVDYPPMKSSEIYALPVKDQELAQSQNRTRTTTRRISFSGRNGGEP
jgi:hypothetical protein